ncbi:MAG TPA: SRPBCC domain-containing protein [Puia sp.]|nr:SRPBCC domain-containing protein [Puia sp.]
MNLLFDFTVDKTTKTIYITREFAADLDLVWDAFTKPEMLDQWMGPKPWRVQTKEMDFREGGRWWYAMVSPENVEHYSLVEYIKIQPKTSFSTKNTFADENGNSKGNAFSLVKNSFQEGTGITTVHVEKVFDDLSTLEMMATNGFKEGTAVGYNNLDEFLRTLVTNK